MERSVAEWSGGEWGRVGRGREGVFREPCVLSIEYWVLSGRVDGSWRRRVWVWMLESARMRVRARVRVREVSV
jgi:hypothetical protein